MTNAEPEAVQAGVLMWMAENLRMLPALGLEPDHFPTDHGRVAYGWLQGLERDYFEGVEVLDAARAAGGKVSDAWRDVIMKLDGLPSTDLGNLLGWVRVLKRGAARREARGQAMQISKLGEATDDPERILAALNAAKNALEIRIGDADGVNTDQKPSDLLTASLIEGDRVDLGFRKITERLKGGPFRGSIFTVLGKPNAGKTTWALNVAARVAALHQDQLVIFDSLEMSVSEVWQRLMMAECGLRDEDLRNLLRNGGEWPNMGRGAFDEKYKNLKVLDNVRTIPQLSSRVTSMQQRVALIVIDFLQYVSVPGTRSVYEKTGEALNQIKSLARSVDCPVMLLSQMNREVKDPSEEPMFAGGRDSGEIEEKSDFVMGLFRPNFWDEVENMESTAMVRAKLMKTKNCYPGTLSYWMDLPTQKVRES